MIYLKKENRIATCDELCRYIREEVKPGDTVRLSLGRVYIPGKVVTNNAGVIQIKIDSDLIKGLTTIDVEKLKEYLIELEHECEGGVCIIEAVDE
ncbi:DUF2097 domain-containing protein [Methanothermobacter sp. THM-2]|uniref:DUF2097 domain-containing protein n=1 Tax=Methanothermobacter sp. THM-2 TaxID=2606912 RepID=UPI001F5BF02B|nr:DUF2097 domain-containing protein [Methanothermobacter sp. THM-2]